MEFKNGKTTLLRLETGLSFSPLTRPVLVLTWCPSFLLWAPRRGAMSGLIDWLAKKVNDSTGATSTAASEPAQIIPIAGKRMRIVKQLGEGESQPEDNPLLCFSL